VRHHVRSRTTKEGKPIFRLDALCDRSVEVGHSWSDVGGKNTLAIKRYCWRFANTSWVSVSFPLGGCHI
jgi:hypothetical protein